MTHDRHNHLPAPARMTTGEPYVCKLGSYGAWSTRCGLCSQELSRAGYLCLGKSLRVCKDKPACKARRTKA